MQYKSKRLDGTGGSKALALGLQMTDQDVVEMFYDAVGQVGNVRKHHSPSMQRRNQKPTWLWKVEGKPAVDLGFRLCPYMGKRRYAKFAEVVRDYHLYLASKNEG